MNLALGNMWSAYDEADLFCFTANSTLTTKWVTRSGGLRIEAHFLVMGAGIARQVRDRYLALSSEAENYNLWRNVAEHMGRIVYCAAGCDEGYYRLAIYEPLKLAAFQVKYHFKPAANLFLITRSAEALAGWMSENPAKRVHLNFPGIGAGLTSPLAVLPSLKPLAATPVTLWVDRPEQYHRIKEAMIEILPAVP